MIRLINILNEWAVKSSFSSKKWVSIDPVIVADTEKGIEQYGFLPNFDQIITISKKDDGRYKVVFYNAKESIKHNYTYFENLQDARKYAYSKMADMERQDTLNEWVIVHPPLVIDYRKKNEPNWKNKTEPIILLYHIADHLRNITDQDIINIYYDTYNNNPFEASFELVDKFEKKLDGYYYEEAEKLYNTLPKTFSIKLIIPGTKIDGKKGTLLKTLVIEKTKENPFKITSISNKWE